MTKDLNHTDQEKIDVFKHFLVELIEDPASSFGTNILKILTVTNDVVIGNKTLESINDKYIFCVEFLLNHKEFFNKFKGQELTIELIQPHYKELLDIFSNWKSQSDIIEEWKDKYTRLFADFENYKKRSIKDKVDFSNDLKIKMNRDIISILDDLTIAKTSLSDEAKSGVEVIFSKLEQYLKGMSIQKVSINKGDIFNSDIAECIATLPSTDFSDGQVVDILKNAWSIDGKVIRYGQVVVCKN